jgi:hypothetical protein
LSEERENFVMVLASGSLAQSHSRYSIGGVDPGVHRQAGGGDGASSLEFGAGRLDVLLSLAEVGTSLLERDLAAADLFGHLRRPQFGQRRAVHNDAVAYHVSPHRAPTPKQPTDLSLPDLHDLDGVPRQPAGRLTPSLDIVSPRLGLLAHRRRTNHHDVDIALDSGLPAGPATRTQ